mgnify:FL=1
MHNVRTCPACFARVKTRSGKIDGHRSLSGWSAAIGEPQTIKTAPGSFKPCAGTGERPMETSASGLERSVAILESRSRDLTRQALATIAEGRRPDLDSLTAVWAAIPFYRAALRTWVPVDRDEPAIGVPAGVDITTADNAGRPGILVIGGALSRLDAGLVKRVGRHAGRYAALMKG